MIRGRCTICHEIFNTDEISATKCGHTFHFNCVSAWLQKHSSCPVCRSKVAGTTDVIQQLFFDRGEDTLASLTGTPEGSAALKVLELSDKVTELEEKLSENDRLRENERKRSADETRNLRRKLTQTEDRLKSFDDIDRRQLTMTRENNNLKKTVTMLNRQVDDFKKEKEKNARAIRRLERENSLQVVENDELTVTLQMLERRLEDANSAREERKKNGNAGRRRQHTTRQKASDAASARNVPMDVDYDDDKEHDTSTEVGDGRNGDDDSESEKSIRIAGKSGNRQRRDGGGGATARRVGVSPKGRGIAKSSTRIPTLRSTVAVIKKKPAASRTTK